LSQERVVVSIEELVERAQQLRNYISQLESSLREITNTLAELEGAKRGIKEIESLSQDFMFYADKKGFLAVKAKELVKERVLVYIGLEYYLETDLKTAYNTLEIQGREIQKSAQAIQEELGKAVETYREITNILEQIRASTESKKSEGK
jgi:prefoldin alpha subunit